jgi:hypothetical protein
MASKEFNTSGIPLAFLITFRCYGTWLHGDDRGSTDRSHNTYGSSFIPSNSRWENYGCRFMSYSPVTLDAHRRSVVEASVRVACRIKRWGFTPSTSAQTMFMLSYRQPTPPKES